MHCFTSIDGNRLALELREVEAILEKDRGIQIVTRCDTYMVKGDFLDICDAVEKAKEGRT